VCQQVKENLFGERNVFKDGMSVSDLMHAHASRERYEDFPNWSEQRDIGPYCFHSDWAVGYYLNYYRLSDHIEEWYEESSSLSNWQTKSFYFDLPTFRIGGNFGSLYKTSQGICMNDGVHNCDGSNICHRLNPDEMNGLRKMK
jgi:hypothetical protein